MYIYNIFNYVILFIVFIIIIKVSNGLQCVMQYWVHVSDETNGEQKHYCLTIIKINACYCFFGLV